MDPELRILIGAIICAVVHVSGSLVVIVQSSRELDGLHEWEEVTTQDMSNAIILLTTTIGIGAASICSWIPMICYKKFVSWMIQFTALIIFLCLFILLTITTIYATANNWFPSEMTPEVVEVRIQHEKELGCCYYRDIDLKIDSTRIDTMTVYGDCPYVINKTLAIDQSSCEELDSTTVCEVNKSDFESDYVCEQNFKETTKYIRFYGNEITICVALVFVIIAEIQFFKNLKRSQRGYQRF